jgi:divinyl protochlorophyllide a 8-vinyl-reductase
LTAAPAARIGPNTVTQLVAALRLAGLGDATRAVFAAADAADWLVTPPAGMMDERRVARLHQTLRAVLPDEAASVLAEAGRLTADHLLANAIPRPAQAAFRLLPASCAARLLVPMIRSLAWTFAGSGRFAARAGLPTQFELTGNPLCAGERAAGCICTWHAAVFQRLFAALVSPAATCVETECAAHGDALCRFTVSW